MQEVGCRFARDPARARSTADLKRPPNVLPVEPLSCAMRHSGWGRSGRVGAMEVRAVPFVLAAPSRQRRAIPSHRASHPRLRCLPPAHARTQGGRPHSSGSESLSS